MAPPSHAQIAVVGAAGFLGGALTRALRAGGEHVVAVTRHEPALTPAGHLRDDLREVRTLYWAASRINPMIAAQRPDLVAEDLADFARFIDTLHAEQPAVRVVLLSSGGTVYGAAARPPHRESTPPDPANDYGRAKLAIEDLLHAHDVTSVVARISNAYGPGQQAAPGQGVIGHWLRAVLAEASVTVFGDLGTVRDYVFVDDVVDLLTRLHGSARLPATVNVGSGRPTDLAEVVRVVEQVVGPGRLRVELAPHRPFDIDASWLDVTLARRELGWSPATDLVSGVRAMWQWLQAGG